MNRAPLTLVVSRAVLLLEIPGYVYFFWWNWGDWTFSWLPVLLALFNYITARRLTWDKTPARRILTLFLGSLCNLLLMTVGLILWSVLTAVFHSNPVTYFLLSCSCALAAIIWSAILGARLAFVGVSAIIDYIDLHFDRQKV